MLAKIFVQMSLGGEFKTGDLKCIRPIVNAVA